jgi:hypothetical protein
MSRTKATIATITARDMRKLKDRSFGRRSDVYRYLHKNYKRLVQQKVGTDEGPSWDEIAAVVSEQGYVSARGDPLNGNAVRRVFRRVERDVKRQEMDAARQTRHVAFPPASGLATAAGGGTTHGAGAPVSSLRAGGGASPS